jgi:hypothetical protein
LSGEYTPGSKILVDVDEKGESIIFSRMDESLAAEEVKQVDISTS